MKHALLILLLVLAPATLWAQFATPIPLPYPDSLIRNDDYRLDFREWLRAERPDVVAEETDDQERGRLIDAYCAEREILRVGSTPECRTVLSALGEALISVTNPARIPQREVLGFRPIPFTQHRPGVARYLRSSGVASGLTPLSRFSSGISDDNAFLITEIVSGLIGRATFAVQYAAVVAKADVDSAPSARRALEGKRANALRLINNGGTVTGRVLFPVFATRGTNMQAAGSTYIVAGILGAISEQDSLRLSGAMVAEVTGAINIRDVAGPLVAKAHLMVAARAGVTYAERDPLGRSRKGIPFGQLGIGLRQGDSIGLSVLLSIVADGAVQDLVPRMIVNFSALR